ncbi:transposase-like protein [Bradyrhizobium sp. USDA 4449]
MNSEQQTSVASVVNTSKQQKGGPIASIPDHDGNAAKITAHLDAGGTLFNCGVSWHFRKLLKQERPDFWADALLRSAENARQGKIRAAHRNMMLRTHCKRGHLLTPETSRIITVKHHVQTRGTWQHRECQICRREFNKTSKFTTEQVDALLKGAEAGLTLSRLTSYRHPDTRVMRVNQYNTAMCADPKIAAMLRPIFARNRSIAHQLVHPRKLILPKRIDRRPVLTGIIAAPSNEIFTAVDSAVPRYLDCETRKEVLSAMMLAILEGTLAIEDAPQRWREFQRAAYRMFPTKYGPVSLDGPAFRDSETPLVERISVGLWN